MVEKGHRQEFSIVFIRIDHKNDTIKCSKQSEQSTFLLCGVLPFCFVVKLVFWLDRLKCHREMLEFATQPKHITGCDVAFNLV